MRKLLGIVAVLLTIGFTACLEEDESIAVTEQWIIDNESYVTEMEQSGEFEKIIAEWDTTQYILLKYNTAKNPTGKQPILTSTVDITYKGSLYDATPFDSSYLATDSLYQGRVDGLVTGFQIALQYMHEGENCSIIIPWQLGYGSSGYSTIPSYATLLFDIDLIKVYRDYAPL